MTQPDKTPLKIVNSSGFLFQSRVAHEIESTSKVHTWIVTGEEHRWQSYGLKTEGYIDIVAEESHYGMRIAIECKKQKDKSWIFLIPKTNGKPVSRARVHWTFLVEHREAMTGWDDFELMPQSVESSACVMQEDNGSRKNTLLEQMADPVLASVEALANEELRINESLSEPGIFKALYLPMIVTNCELQACWYNQFDIDNRTGEIDEANVEFETVPFVRFRKNLSTLGKSLKKPKDLQEANQENERTIFIVNSAHLIDFLRESSLITIAGIGSPWNIAYKRIQAKY